jgi:hypothetical protein
MAYRYSVLLLHILGSSRWYNIDDRAHVAEFGSRSMQSGAEDIVKGSSDDAITMEATQAVAVALEDEEPEGYSPVAMDVASAAVVVEAEPVEAAAQVMETVSADVRVDEAKEGDMNDISRVWLASLQPGSLVDAKDSNGVWWQVSLIGLIL